MSRFPVVDWKIGSKRCKGKRTYSDMRTAEIVIFNMWTSGTIKTGELHAYECPNCGKFHVGHPRVVDVVGSQGLQVINE